MKLSERQSAVLEELKKVARQNAVRYRGKTEHLFLEDCKKLAQGDEYCTFGMGGLTWQVGDRLGLGAHQVLPVFKALERKGLVRRESTFRDYQRPLYWWPVGMADTLVHELGLAP